MMLAFSTRVRLLLALLLVLLAAGCERKLPLDFDVPEFKVEHLPFHTSLARGDTLTVRCWIVGHDRRSDYHVRYHQGSGQGGLLLGDERLVANETYRVEPGEFRLRYVSECRENQSLQLVFRDDFGHEVPMELELTDETPAPPPPARVHVLADAYDTVASIYHETRVRCRMVDSGVAPGREYLLTYSNHGGQGRVRVNGTVVEPVERGGSIRLPAGDFTVGYTPTTLAEKQELGFMLVCTDDAQLTAALGLRFVSVKADALPEFNIEIRMEDRSSRSGIAIREKIGTHSLKGRYRLMARLIYKANYTDYYSIYSENRHFVKTDRYLLDEGKGEPYHFIAADDGTSWRFSPTDGVRVLSGTLSLDPWAQQYPFAVCSMEISVYNQAMVVKKDTVTFYGYKFF